MVSMRDINDPGGCWLVSGPDHELLALLVGLKSEVIGEARLYAGFYRGGRSGSVRALTAREALVYARVRRRRLHMATGLIMLGVAHG